MGMLNWIKFRTSNGTQLHMLLIIRLKYAIVRAIAFKKV